MIEPVIFKDYDIRGTYPEQINYEIAKLIGKALTVFLKSKVVAVGRDMRLSGEEIFKGFTDGVMEQGVDIIDLGLISTDMLYFATGKYKFDGAMITASHNPSQWNGFKFGKSGAIAISGATGINDIKDLAIKGEFPVSEIKGTMTQKDIMSDWVNHALSFIDYQNLSPLKIVVDAGNGMAGKIMPEVDKKLPGEFIGLYYNLDGSFPNHVPSPIEPKNMVDLQKKVLAEKADVGMAFDGDADRVFLVDGEGEIVSGTVMTALVAKMLLEKNKDEIVLYNAICGRIVPQTIEKYGGKGVRVRVGHTYIKQHMRDYNAVFCGEHSGHYFFRENFFADSGLIAALIVLELISKEKKKLSDLRKDFDIYPQSGEINFIVSDIPVLLKSIKNNHKDAQNIDELDGLSFWYQDFWFNMRSSKTEPLLRLNIEADNKELLKKVTMTLIAEIESSGGKRKE